MSNAWVLRPSPEETIRLMQQELAQTNREVMLLTIELEKKVSDLEEVNRDLRRHRELIDLSSDAVITLDANRLITGWNRGAEEMYDWTAAEAIGQPIESFLQTQPVNPGENFHVVLQEKLRWDGELTHLRKDGRRLTVESRHVLLRDSQGQTLGFLEINRDLTERRQLEEQLRQSQKLESIGQLAGGVAHDFNNLLSVIGGYSEMILSDLPPESELRESLEEISLAASRAAALTRQLLAFSRRQAAAPVDLVLNEVVRSTEKMLRRLLTADIQLVLSLEPNEAVIRADRNHIEQVILNLAVNARDAMRHGGTLAIETRLASIEQDSAEVTLGAPPNEYLMLSVSDTGTGMTPEIKSRIFEPFFTTKEKGKGTGLGLSTVYGIVKQCRGWIAVDSEPGCGTTFRILFPRSQATAAQVQTNEPERDLSGSETILLAEDDEGVRRFVRQALEKHGYRVLDASTGQQALTVAAHYSGTIHLLLSDIVMPELGGIQLAQHLGEVRPGIAVLWMSGLSEQLLDLSAPRVSFVHKPFSARTILRELRKLLDVDQGGAEHRAETW
jgi:two-component system, cell cycle sensor histidine kinase and response regulator CckA